MVWILTPNHPSLGCSKYYFTSSGAYKVGRKDCAVVIQTDKTVSRLHAEIKIDPTKSRDELLDITNVPIPRIILRDLSKFGSFVNRTVGSKPVFSLPNKETELKEGDIVTFGTDSSSFRLEYLSLIPHITPLADKSRRDAIVSAVASVGGYTVDKWCAECTHLIVEDGSNVSDNVIKAVAEKKPVIGISWIEAISARNSISSEFPSFSRFTPNLLWKIGDDAKFLKIIEPEARLTAFKGFTFYVGSVYLYNCKDLLQLLVESSGGKFLSVTELSRSRVSQNPQQKPNELLILPALEPKPQRWMSPEELKSISHVRKTSEEKFIAAVLAGEFKDEYFEDPASPAASAASDETVEASHSDYHDDEISSSVHVVGQPLYVAKDAKWAAPSEVQVMPKISQAKMQRDGSRASFRGSGFRHNNEIIELGPISKEQFKDVQKLSGSPSANHLQAIPQHDANESARITSEGAGDFKAVMEFRKDLVVRMDVEPSEKDSSVEPPVHNFKGFRKKHGISGNSFTALVPFAKEPYRESDFTKEVQEYIQQEKKRKQAEAMAEDLFNAEQLKRKKGVGTSLVSALREGRLNVN